MSAFNHFRKAFCLFALYFLAGALLQSAAAILPMSLPAFAISWFLLSTTVFLFHIRSQEGWAAFAGALAGLFLSAGDSVALPAGFGLLEMCALLLVLFVAAALSCSPDEKGQCLRWFSALLFVVWIVFGPAAFRLPALGLLALALFVQSQAAEGVLKRRRLQARSFGR